MENVQEKRIFVAYEFSLLFKAIQAFLEVVAGMLIYIISTNNISGFVLNITHGELLESPNDFFSNFLIHNANQLSVNGKFFIVFYLLSHGIIKLIIISGLFLKKLWAYPASVIGLGGLILYQLYRLVLTHSIILLMFTIMDIIILWLIWHEHKIQKIKT